MNFNFAIRPTRQVYFSLLIATVNPLSTLVAIPVRKRPRTNEVITAIRTSTHHDYRESRPLLAQSYSTSKRQPASWSSSKEKNSRPEHPRLWTPVGSSINCHVMVLVLTRISKSGVISFGVEAGLNLSGAQHLEANDDLYTMKLTLCVRWFAGCQYVSADSFLS
ncbi:hypothetical protein ASPBRDRAFT_199751 [Aspergillus brasiliensis CBS 101740]|uniref:Uncharacterized protein n=1 Tax=Aspergillus brasiliensis (strain CBS 101740 / IMI 381727 / IBT 21946) TaxID=767769 RepID=A0A1L9U8N3_ASPBC|nr:hypothetical protein ASPBRDRAFT_199751 [Aspergillus brasiliensis CBS 101740]